MAKNYLSDDEVFGTKGYLSEDEVFGTSAPVTDTGDETARLAARYKAPEQPGIIQRVFDALKPAPFKSVMEDHQPTAQERQADVDRRLSYGAGPVSTQTAAQADLVRSGMAKTDSPVVKKVAKAMDEQGVPSIGDLMDRAQRQQDLEQNDRFSRQAFAQENPMLGALGSGAAMSVAGAINIPTVAADFLNETAVNPVLRAFDLPELPRAPQMFGTEYLTKAAADFMPDIGRKSMKGAWNRDEFGQWLGVKLAANSTQIAQSLVAAFSPALRAVLLPGMAGTAAGQSFVEGDDSRVAVAKGAIEYATEKLPLQAFDKIGDILKGMGPTKSSAVLAVAGQRLLQAGGSITANGLTNAIEEVAAQLGGNALDRYFQGKDIELTKGLDESAVVGAATGKLMSTPQVAATLSGAYDPNAQVARAMDQEIASTEFSVPASEVAADLLNPNSYDQRQISPAETTRPGQVLNFTEPDSATAQAGLTPIVVPMPDAPAETPLVAEVNPQTEQAFGLDKLRMGASDVSTSGAVGPAIAGGGQPSGDLNGAGLGDAGLAGVDAVRSAGVGASGLAPVGGEVAPMGVAAGQQPAPLTAENNNAVGERLIEPWFGRKGGGYSTRRDAEQALPGRQRMFPNLQWRVDQMPNGRFMLGGYESTTQETTLGTQTTQAVQAETQGQEAAAVAGATPAAGAAAPAPKLQDSGVPGLKFAPTASLKNFKVFQNSVAADGIQIAPVRMSEMNDTHKLASLVTRLLGKTYTVARVTDGDPMALSNGMINKLGGNDIVVAENTNDAPLFVAIHEAYHGLPQAERKALNAQLLQLFRAENKGQFLKDFNYTEAEFDEEAPAFMAQVISKRADFWEELRTKMGDGEFAQVAKIILDSLNNLLRKVSGTYGQDFANTYISDIVKARDLLTTAYAKAMQQQGQQASTEPAGVVASSRSEDIGAKLQARVDNDFDALVQEYNSLKGTDGGRILDADIARELSPEYRANRARAPEVHEAVSSFIEKLFTQRVRAASETGGMVVFKAGGGGAGKSSAEAAASNELRRAHTVWDGTLSSPDKAARMVQMVLDNNQAAVVVYIYRDPLEALADRSGGVLKRAMQTRRVVPLYSLVKTHSGASETVRMLEQKYGDDKRFGLRVVNNSFGPGAAQPAALSDLTPVIKSGLKEKLREATDQAFAEGFIDQEIYDRTVAEPAGATEVAAPAGADAQGVRREAQERAGSEGQGNAVTKDEAVVDGVRYSTRKRDLVDIPTIELKDLVGKKVFGIKADLTDAGRSYTGIDGSQLEFPIEMMGGPNYVRLPDNAKASVIWAVRGGAVLTKIMEQVKKSDYVLVHAMNGNSHLTNSTISSAYLQTVEAYLRDGRISKENLLALDEIVRSPKNKSGLPDFPGFESPEIYSYIDGLSFDQRGALASILEKKEAQAHGLPNLDRFRRETIDPEFAGYRQGDAMLVLKVDKENPTVKLGEEGTKMHPSYPLGLRGTVIGKLAKGINYETIFRDYFDFAVPNFKNGEAGAWYAFDRKMPIQKITQKIADSVAPGAFTSIKTARQAEAALAFANGNWLVSGKTKAQGGVSVQEFVDALRANEGAAALTLYTAEEVKAGIKDKSFTVYQLGKEGGDKGLQVFFGLKRGAPWYKDMIEGVTDNEVEVVSVTNNENGAPGIGIPAIITKAISEGATVLDAFAVKSARFPNGFLPEMYSQFGFEEIGRIPFDPSYYDANGLADLKAFWARGGWKEADGYPDVVVMRWRGNDEDRATAIERYVRTGETSVSDGSARFVGSPTADAHGQRNKSRAKQGRAGRADGGQARGDQGTGDAASVVSRAYGSIQELAGLGDGDIRNLGLDPAEVQRLRDGLAGVRRSNRSAEPARGPSARTDEAARPGTVTGIHYGKAAGLSRLSGAAFGSGIKGAEQARLNEPGVDPRIKKRVYFYLTNNNADMPRPEIGLGAHVYRATLGNMFDMATASVADKQRVQSLRKTPDANGFESAVLDAGYRGYLNREQGTAVVLNADVPVVYEGLAEAGRMRDRVIQRQVQAVATRTEGDELVRKPTNDEMVSIIKARPALAEAAPSFKLQFGEARVKQSESEAADQVLADAGSSFQFGGVMRSNRVTDTPAFKRWFGDSKVVDENGEPLVVYHGTNSDFTAFDDTASGANSGNRGFLGRGFYFSSSPQSASMYAGVTRPQGTDTWRRADGGNVMPVYLSLQNPLEISERGLSKEAADALNSVPGIGLDLYEGARSVDGDLALSVEQNPELSDAIRSTLTALGYDGVVLDGGREIVAFKPTQIKSATGNEGTFDPENPDIRKSNRARESWFLGRDELGRIKLGAGAKAYRAAADLASNVLDKVGMKPISTDLGRAMRQMKVEIAKAREVTADVASKLSELSEQERAMISDVIEKELKRGVKPPQRVLEVAASMKDIMSEQTAELVRLGMLSADAAGRWDGKYLPRFYESKLKDEGKAWAKAAKALFGRPKAMQGIGGSSLKGRGLFQTVPVEELEQWLAEGWEERDPNFDPDVDTEITVWRDYTREERENMGEIRDAMFRFIMGYNKSQRDISLGRLYENLANTVASKSEKEGYVQVPSTNVEDTRARRYGKLAGKWVPREVMDHLSGFDEFQNNDLMRMYTKAMSMWKEGKTVLNPVSHANNVLSNVTMAHFAGVSYWDVNKYVAATRDIVKKAPMLQEAKDAGLWLGTMTQSELVEMLPDQLKELAAKSESKAGKAVDSVWNAMAFWLRKPLGKAYEAEDLFFRYLIYRDARGRGLSPAEAVEYAQKYIFTYDDLPKTARRVRDFALPFFAYTYKVVPTLAQTALEQPWRLAAPAAVLYTVNAMMYAFAAGADDDDWMEVIKRYMTDEDFREKARAMEKDERVNLPPWMKGATAIGTPKTIRLGTDEATDLPVFLDVARIFPGGDLFDAHNNAGGVPLLAPITPNHPILTSAAAILFNKDTFRGTEIVKASDTDAEAAAKRAKWAWQQVAPAIAIGNGHFDRAMNVIANATGEPVNLYFTEYTGVGKDGMPVQPSYAAMQTVGIKARPIDLETSAAINKAQQNKLIREIEAEIRSAQRLERKGAMTPDQADRIIERQKEKRQRLKEGLTVDGDEQE